MDGSVLDAATISVIVPIYNVERYLRQCLDSIVNQTYKNLDIILIDDGSPDNSGAICDEYEQTDSRITVIHKANGGLCAARNDGIERATGDWIAFVDSDDWCEPDYFEQYMKARERTGDAPDVLLSQGRLLEYSHKQLAQTWFSEPFHYTGRKQIEMLMTNLHIYGLPWDKLYNSSFLKRNQLKFDVSCKALEDFLFNFQVYDHAADVVACSFIGYHNRVVTGTSITGGYNPNKFQVVYHTLQVMDGYAKQHNIAENAMIGIEKAAITAIVHSLDCYYFHPANSKTYAQTAREIKAMKKEPLIKKAIYGKNNGGLSKKAVVLKHAMRLPWVWPLKLLHMGRKILNRIEKDQ